MNLFKSAHALPILAGILIGTSYIPFPPWAALFALAPLWLFWLKQNDLKSIFIGGWITQFVLNLIGFHWIAYTVTEFGQLPWVAGFGVLLLYCALAHLYYPISGVLWFLLTRKLNLSKNQSLLLLPIIFLFVERIYPFIFYWHLGYTWLWASYPGSQLAPWIGFYGLNVVTIFCNYFVLKHLLFRKTERSFWSPHIGWGLGLFLGVNALGALSGHFYDESQQKTVKAIAVQGNIGNLDKLKGRYGGQAEKRSVETFISLSTQALEAHPEAELLIWPETAFPEPIVPGRTRPHMRKVQRFLKQHQVDLITGAYQFFPNDERPYNAMVHISKEGKVSPGYQKTHLLAYGEYFPGSQTFPFLKDWFPMVSDFGRGKGATPFDYNGIKVGGQICYEGLFDTFSAALQDQGAQFMINITNDSWFWYPFEPHQHMYMTLARALETRRSLIRVTNTGVTSAITGGGRILKKSPHGEPWFGLYEIPYPENPQPTLYAKIAPWWPHLLLLALIVLLGGKAFAQLRQH